MQPFSKSNQASKQTNKKTNKRPGPPPPNLIKKEILNEENILSIITLYSIGDFLRIVRWIVNVPKMRVWLIFFSFFLRAELLLYKLLEIYERLFFLSVANNSNMYIERPVLQINSDVCKAPFAWISPSKLAAHFPSPCLCNNSYFPWFLLVFKYSSVIILIVWPLWLAKFQATNESLIHLEHELFSI